MTLENDVFGLEQPDPFSEDADEHGINGWTSTHWWAWTLALLVLGTTVLLAAGAQLSGATFGTSLRAQACDISTLPGLTLLLLGAFLLSAGLMVVRLRRAGSVLTWDPGSLVLSLPIPLTLMIATLPGVLGCRIAADIEQIGLVGSALVGQGGIVLCIASTVLVAVSLAGSVHVSWLAPGTVSMPAEPGIVERAVLEAEAMESDSTAHRFRGVDPEP